MNCKKKKVLPAGSKKEALWDKCYIAVKRAIVVSSFIYTNAMCRLYAYASSIDIDTSYKINSDISNINPEGMVIGLGIWVARLIGIGMLIWGIYGYFTARKDGEAESMNGALGKLSSGIALIFMPNILRGLKVIS